MWRTITEAQARAASRRLFAAYLFISGIALIWPHRPKSWLILAALHAAGIWLLLNPRVLQPLSARWPRLSRVIRDWYFLIVMPLLYTELAVLNVSVFNGRYFDSIILGWEQNIFNGQPSQELAQTYPHLPLSEYLHFSYISYYLIIYGPPLYLYLHGKRAQHQQVIFTLMLAFLAHYLFFIYFPVQGPRYLFPAPSSGDISGGFFYNLAHKLLEAGSSRGAAFPSSHVGVSFAQSAFAFLAMPAVAPLILILSASLAVGAVYGGFHYATDAVIGMLFGLLLFACAPVLVRALVKTEQT